MSKLQVLWVEDEHIQCARNTHLLGELGHAPAMKLYTLRSLLRPSLATNTHSFRLTCKLASCPHDNDRT